MQTRCDKSAILSAWTVVGNRLTDLFSVHLILPAATMAPGFIHPVTEMNTGTFLGVKLVRRVRLKT
jgi:hypothetical protein